MSVDIPSSFLSVFRTDIGWGRLILLLGSNALFGDASLLAGEVAQVVELCTTYLTNFVHLNTVDAGAVEGEDTLHTYSAGHFADSEALVLPVTTDLDADTTVELDALLVTFDNFVCNSYGVASLECGMAFACCKCFFSNFD